MAELGEMNKIYLPEVVGKGYGKFWNWKGRYRVVKGSRASKKSTTIALNIICRMMQYPLANTLVVRKTASTLKESCFAQLRWAIERLGVGAFWKSRVSPLELEYLPTGQKIIFRGLDDPLKITSITVAKGHLCWAWLEECFEIEENDFNMINESLRGELPKGYFVQCTLSLNPWSSSCWVKARFFDMPSENVLAITTTYQQNEWLSEEDKILFEDMKKNDPQRYLIAGLGQWGVPSGQFFREWNEKKHLVKPFKIPAEWRKFRAADWGQARPYAVLWFAVDYDGNLWCYRELYGYGGKANVGTGETAAELGRRILALESRAENVEAGYLDSACWGRNGVTGETLAEAINKELVKKNLALFSKSSKGRVEGANAFKQRLIGNKNSEGEFVPAIRFFTTCIHTARTIPMLGHDPHNPETYDTDGEDHCLVAGTLITTKRGKVSIEKITSDDFVLTRRGFKKVLAAGLTRRNAKVMTIEFSNGKFLTGTGNHPIFVIGENFVPLANVKIGNEFVSETREKIIAVEIHDEEIKFDVYNLTVEGEPEYFANGVLVHNCADAICYACLSRPWVPMRAKPPKKPDAYKPEEKVSAWAF